MLNIKETDNDEDRWEEVGKGNKSTIMLTVYIYINFNENNFFNFLQNEHEFEESPITKIFGGKIRSSIKKYHSKTTTTIQPFFFIHLDIKVDFYNKNKLLFIIE